MDDHPDPRLETAPAQDLIFDADAAGPNNIYAAGIRGGAYNAMLMHWDGTAWSLVELPATIPSNADLSTVAVDSTGAWAMGNKYNPLSGYWQPFILHKQGATWVEVQMNATQGCEATDDDAFYRFDPGGIAIGNDGDLWVTGTCATGHGDAGVLARYRAGHWRSAFDPADFPTTTQINDVYAAPGRKVRAVGAVGTEPLVLARSTGLDFVREPRRRSAAAPRSTRSAPASATTPSASTPAPTRGPTRRPTGSPVASGAPSRSRRGSATRRPWPSTPPARRGSWASR